ncbi:MAG TPA: hypothetical protein VK745_31845 [Polyangiaceae bacterium]|nr:hypothetical protein [Polyangiaceae bacterium]
MTLELGGVHLTNALVGMVLRLSMGKFVLSQSADGGGERDGHATWIDVARAWGGPGQNESNRHVRD